MSCLLSFEDCFHGSEQRGAAVEFEDCEDVSMHGFQVLNPRFRGLEVRKSRRVSILGCSFLNRKKDTQTFKESLRIDSDCSDVSVSLSILNEKSISTESKQMQFFETIRNPKSD